MEIDSQMTQMLKLADKDFLKIFLFLLFKIFLFFKPLLTLVQYCFCFMFWFFGPQGMWFFGPWGIAPWPGIEFVPHALKGSILNHWAAREVLRQGFVKARL